MAILNNPAYYITYISISKTKITFIQWYQASSNKSNIVNKWL